MRQDIEGIIRAHEHWDQYFRKLGVGQIEYQHDDLEQAIEQRLGGGFHQAGTTRMSASPANGVVDREPSRAWYPERVRGEQFNLCHIRTSEFDLHGCRFRGPARRPPSPATANFRARPSPTARADVEIGRRGERVDRNERPG